jgi:aspartokinase
MVLKFGGSILKDRVDFKSIADIRTRVNLEEVAGTGEVIAARATASSLIWGLLNVT